MMDTDDKKKEALVKVKRMQQLGINLHAIMYATLNSLILHEQELKNLGYQQKSPVLDEFDALRIRIDKHSALTIEKLCSDLGFDKEQCFSLIDEIHTV